MIMQTMNIPEINNSSVTCSSQRYLSKSRWTEGLEELQNKAISRSIRRYVFKEYSTGKHPSAITIDVINKNDRLLTKMIDEIASLAKPKKVKVTYRPNPLLSPTPNYSVTNWDEDDATSVNIPERSIFEEDFTEKGLQEFKAQYKKEKLQSLNHLVGLADFNDALRTRNKDPQHPLYPHITKESGVEIICRNYADLYAMTSPNPILLSKITFKPDAALGGGAKTKIKYNQRRRKRARPKMVKSVQLGQINRYVPYDKPVTTTLRFNGSLITDGAGTLSARLSLRNPLRAFNGSGSYVNAVDFAALYDQYKVKNLQFQFEPTVTGPLRGPIAIAFDYDSPDTSTPNYANIVNYGGYRIFNAGTQFEIETRVPNITSAFDTSTDPPTALVVHQGGWIDAATPAAPGNMFIGGINLGNSVTLGNFVATLRIAWRFRR